MDDERRLAITLAIRYSARPPSPFRFVRHYRNGARRDGKLNHFDCLLPVHFLVFYTSANATICFLFCVFDCGWIRVNKRDKLCIRTLRLLAGLFLFFLPKLLLERSFVRHYLYTTTLHTIILLTTS